MMFIELFVPKNSITAERRQKLAQRFMRSMTGDEHAMDERAKAVYASQFHVVVHEPEAWIVGDDPVGEDGPAPYMVRAHVPGPWRKDISEYLITAFTQLILDEDPAAAVQVHVLGVTEGSIGIHGEAKTSVGLVEMMNEPLQQDLAEGRAVIDPMCDMIVPLATAPTLEWEGTLYGFCCEGCRTEFVEKKEKEAARAGTG